MHYSCRYLILFLFFVNVVAAAPAFSAPATGQMAADKKAELLPLVSRRLHQELKNKNLRPGSPIFIRIFKLPRTLEVWIKNEKQYQLFKSYQICSYSGHPGPKLQQGDWQSPEGFYTVSREQMNPWSEHHLAFDLGYPNSYDQGKKRTGSAIMVHGGCTSQGCFAMSDHRMEEIYLLAAEALENSQQTFSVHVFPFKMTTENLYKYRHSPWLSFWKNLQTGYDAFEMHKKVPLIISKNGEYHINSSHKLASLK